MIPRWLQRLYTCEAIEGYEHPELVEQVFRKTQAYEPPRGWGLVVGKRTVLDFGGGCGQHYKRARLQCPNIRWAVVETPAMVNRARELETDHLRFFPTISEAKDWLGPVDLMHADGALQYTPDPGETARQLVDVGAQIMFWNRLYLGNGKSEEQWSWLGDNGPGPAIGREKIVRYRRTSIAVGYFISLHTAYWMRWGLEHCTCHRS